MTGGKNDVGFGTDFHDLNDFGENVMSGVEYGNAAARNRIPMRSILPESLIWQT